MNLESIRNALHRQPFQPFSLALADGRKVPVGHPEFVAMTPRIMIVAAEDSSWSVIEPLLIVSIDYPAAKESGGSNGLQN